MTVLTGLPPVVGPGAVTLVLGSMPGEESLRRGQYYAHPRNAFWPIMGALAGAGPELAYAARLQALRDAGITVWDVLGACVRPGSLDSAIDPDSVVVNDFAGFFQAHPTLRRVFFNGSFAETAFRRHVLPTLPADSPGHHAQRLPSTSPAHASLRLEQKLQAWRRILPG